MGYAIAIDGPAGAGKSTIARQVSKQLSFIYVDTGAMYRAMGLYLLRREVDKEHIEAMGKVSAEADITITYQDGEQQVCLNGENVNGFIRTDEVGNMASACAQNPKIRKTLVALQQKLARTADVVMDGRDIGTCVLPDAPLKIFLTASVEERARRRFREFQGKGMEADFEQIRADIADRDYRDENRESSPLKQAEDAVYLDTSDMNIEEVVGEILRLYRERRDH